LNRNFKNFVFSGNLQNFWFPAIFSYLWGLQGRNHSRARGITGEQASKMETTVVAARMASGNDRAQIVVLAPVVRRRAAACRCTTPPRAVDCCV
jgi:hypothetical protein